MVMGGIKLYGICYTVQFFPQEYLHSTMCTRLIVNYCSIIESNMLQMFIKYKEFHCTSRDEDLC
jgi:hypothetical protein